MKLATTYTDLKNTGRIDAYLSKKRKRLASKKKKQIPTRRSTNDDYDELIKTVVKEYFLLQFVLRKTVLFLHYLFIVLT